MTSADERPDFDRDQWGERVAETAAAFAYPPTPDVAGRLRAEAMTSVVAARQRQAQAAVVRRLAFALIALVVLCGALLAVPQVRGAVVQFLQIGGVRVILVEPTVTPTTPTTPTTPPLQATATATITPRPLFSVLDLGGETTLEAARRQVRFPIRLPAYPSDLGQPNAVFVQDLGDQTVMLVWTDPAQPRRVRLALQILGPNAFTEKVQPRVIRETQVRGQRAFWAEGEYMLQSRAGGLDLRRLITGNVLIWQEDEVTYRLETDLPMDEAVKIAESLK